MDLMKVKNEMKASFPELCRSISPTLKEMLGVKVKNLFIKYGVDSTLS